MRLKDNKIASNHVRWMPLCSGVCFSKCVCIKQVPGVCAIRKQWSTLEPLPVAGSWDLSPALALRIYGGPSTCWGSQLALQLLDLIEEGRRNPVLQTRETGRWLEVPWLKCHTALKQQSLECVYPLFRTHQSTFFPPLSSVGYMESPGNLESQSVTLDISGCTVLCCEGSPVHYRLFSSISGLCSPVVKIKNICSHCWMSPGGAKWPWSRTTELDLLGVFIWQFDGPAALPFSWGSCGQLGSFKLGFKLFITILGF